MKTLSIELPEPLTAQLAAIAETQQLSPAEVVREAISAYLFVESAEKGVGPRSFYEAVRDVIASQEGSKDDTNPASIEGANRVTRLGSALESAGELVGSLEGPDDLSTNPAHMEGFGES